MTAHFYGGPWNGKSRYQACEKPHSHTIAVEEVLALVSEQGHYEVDGDPVSTDLFGELLVDVIYVWAPWDEE